MKNRETILELQRRITHIMNHLLGLGKKFEDDELNIKILNYLTRTWEPKIIVIKESNNLASMSMEALFEKFLVCGHKLIQQSHAEETEKKRKGIALKANSSKEDYKESSSDDEDVENFSLMVKKFEKFLKRSKDRKIFKPSKKIENNNNTFTCFKCGKQGHIKSECPIYLKKQIAEKKGKKNKKQKKAYIAWEDYPSTSSDSSSDEEVANVCLMEDSMDDSSTIEETEVNSKFEEVLEAFNEMHEEAQRLPILNKKQKSNLKLHITKLASTQSELDKLRQENEKLVSSHKAVGCVCTSTSLNMDEYKSLQTEFEDFKKDHYVKRIKLKMELSYLKDVFRKLNKGKSDLNHLLTMQKHTTDKTGLGYNKQTTFYKKTKFASSKRVNPNKVSKKKNIVHSKPNVKTYHYCMKRGHTSYKCYVSRFDVPRGKYVWIPKDLIVDPT